ncbi:MAG TPA: XRE family transcriptional regulator [Oceanospirillaceae bacterium]|nr:XRE family transcriptional regulator [Oceanospirillaceae bacterium]
MSLDVGARLKEVRKKRGLSQRELAKRAGVTNSTISLIEQNRVSPSVSSLKKVLDGVPMSLPAFFADEVQVQQQVFYTSSELPDMGYGKVAMRLVGYNHEPRSLSLLHETYPIGADTGSDMLLHEGEEAGIVISGHLEVTVADKTQTLGPGDAYYFASSQPHRFRNTGDEVCVLVSVNNPATV